MNSKFIQEFYPDSLSHCYGCGRLNDDGLHLKSYAEGEDAVAVFQPRPYHIAVPGYVYGGLIASLIDCNSMAAAAAAAYRAEGRVMGSEPAFRYVTASQHMDYLKPTPLGVPLEIRARVKELKGRKAVIEATVSAQGEITARGEIVAVQLPEHMKTHER